VSPGTRGVVTCKTNFDKIALNKIELNEKVKKKGV